MDLEHPVLFLKFNHKEKIMRAYERFLDYVKVHTTSDGDSVTHPSSMIQFDLAKLLVEEMKALGIEDARVDEKCYVYGTIPASEGYESAKPLGFIAHMDTAPDASGKDVKPVLHENYDGEDVLLPGSGAYLSVKQFPFLKEMKGQTLITTDGTTLLGADDKAGIAEILTMAERILTENIPHGKICIGFTPDEEVGQGADFFDIQGFGAAYAYTVDGGDVGEVEYENFNAASATVYFHGVSVHPGSAKDTMINAQNVAMDFHMALPRYERPEHTEWKEGFYHLSDMSGDMTEAKLVYIIRDHDVCKFSEKKDTMLHIAARLNAQYGEGTV
jgi:tripeptide aminopeptidase